MFGQLSFLSPIQRSCIPRPAPGSIRWDTPFWTIHSKKTCFLVSPALLPSVAWQSLGFLTSVFLTVLQRCHSCKYNHVVSTSFKPSMAQRLQSAIYPIKFVSKIWYCPVLHTESSLILPLLGAYSNTYHKSPNLLSYTHALAPGLLFIFYDSV